MKLSGRRLARELERRNCRWTSGLFFFAIPITLLFGYMNADNGKAFPAAITLSVIWLAIGIVNLVRGMRP